MHFQNVTRVSVKEKVPNFILILDESTIHIGNDVKFPDHVQNFLNVISKYVPEIKKKNYHFFTNKEKVCSRAASSKGAFCDS